MSKCTVLLLFHYLTHQPARWQCPLAKLSQQCLYQVKYWPEALLLQHQHFYRSGEANVQSHNGSSAPSIYETDLGSMKTDRLGICQILAMLFLPGITIQLCNLF